ncbi:hypothetical protein [Diaphorobacter sp.]|uniref:hypothetical protein n=1 Tax=Diaphorobacter sp. TaxID=1934310 RepID=UPI0028AFF0B7|nr:hypothetical protein [Diaphorobacter sp.]
MQIHIQQIRGLLAAAAVAVSFAGAAQEAPPLHVLTCNMFSKTAGAIPPSEYASNIHTYKTTDRTNPAKNGQPYWSGAVEKTRLFHSAPDPIGDQIGVLPAPSSNSFNPPSSLPQSMESGWIDLSRPSPGVLDASGAVGFTGDGKPNVNPNVMYYFRYAFRVDPLIEAEQLSLTLLFQQIDDFVKGVYVNGTLVRFPSDASTLTATVPSTLKLAADTNVHWQAGVNEIVLAVLNAKDPEGRHNPSTVGIGMRIAGSSDCSTPPTITPPEIPAPLMRPGVPLSYSGSMTHGELIESVTVWVTRESDGEMFGPYPATIGQKGGTYRITNAPALPEGVYTARATLSAPTSSGYVYTRQTGGTTFQVAAPGAAMTKAVPGLGPYALFLLGLLCCFCCLLVRTRVRHR